MATYLKFHQLESSPFEGPDSDRLVLATEALRRAYAEIKSGLDEGSPRICLSGGPGIGKSSLARALPRLLSADAQCALIRDPSREWPRIKASIAKQLGLEAGQLSRASLMAARRDGRRIVLVIDQAEHLPAESLEHLDVVLGYRDDESEQLAQCVLLANLEAAPRGKDVPLLWWLDKLTTRQLTLSPIPEAGLRSYIDKHLKKAGADAVSLFNDDAIVAIHRYTGGVPGAVSALCEELLSKAASLGTHTITPSLVARIFGDEPEDAQGSAEEESTTPALELAEPTPDAGQEAPGREDELPHFGGRPGRSERPSPIASEFFAPPEPELDVQQGLLPVEETNHYRDPGESADFFGDSFGDSGRTRDASPHPEAHRYEYGVSPGSGRGARMVRNLIGLAVIAVLAAIAHAWWNDLSPATPAKALAKAKAIAHAVTSEPAATPTEESTSLPGTPPEPLPGIRPDGRELAVTARVPEDAPERAGDAELEGLTSDLKLDASASNAAALDAANGGIDETEGPPEAETPSLSLGELYEIAEKAKAEPKAEVFEPWSQQVPEATPAAPAASR